MENYMEIDDIFACILYLRKVQFGECFVPMLGGFGEVRVLKGLVLRRNNLYISKSERVGG